MKRSLLLCIILAITYSVAIAQRHLHVGKYFNHNDAITHRPTTTEVIMVGEPLKEYKQTLYHSLSFEATEEEVQELNRLLNKDIAAAKGKDVRRLAGRVAFAFCLIGTKEGTNQYLLYKNSQPKSKEGANIVLIYIEGKVSPNELRQQFSL